MCKLVGALFLLGLGAVFGHPAKDKLMIDVGGDTAVVESTVREARQVPEHIEELLQPGVKDAFILTYGDKQGDAGDIQGYSKKLNDRGNDGYRHFDTYHKKDADKYGYEVHKEFGKSNSANVDTTDKNGKYKDKDNNADGEESQTLYRVSGESKDDQKYKNALDDFRFVYFGGNGGSDKSAGDGATAESDGGKSESYEENDSYSEGGSSSYEEGDDGESGTSGSGSYSSGGETGSYTSADDEDAEGHEEAEGDDY